MAEKTDPDLREYKRMTAVLEQPGGQLAEEFPSGSADSGYDRLGRRLRRSGLYGSPTSSADWRRILAAQAAIGDIGVGSPGVPPGEVDDAVAMLRHSGIEVSRSAGGSATAIHPFTKRRVSALRLAWEIEGLAEAFDAPGTYGDRIKSAAKALKTGTVPPDANQSTVATAKRALRQARGEAADTHLKRDLRGKRHRQRVAANIDDPSVVQGIKSGAERAERKAVARVARGVVEGAGRKVAGAAGGALAGPVLELAAREDPSVRGELRATEELVTQIPGLAQRGSLPVTGVEPERIDAALAARRARAQGFPESQYRAPAWWQAKQAAAMRPAPDIGPPQEGLAEVARQALYALGIGSPGAKIEQAEVDWLIAEDERKRAAESIKPKRPQHAAPRTRTME